MLPPHKGNVIADKLDYKEKWQQNLYLQYKKMWGNQREKPATLNTILTSIKQHKTEFFVKNIWGFLGIPR